MAAVHLFVEPRQPDVGRIGAQLALARISMLDSRESQLGRLVKEGIVVPMSTQADPTRVDLPPGKYVVSVNLPSGEQLVRPLLVTGLDAEPITLVLSARESPVAHKSARRRAVRVGRVDPISVEGAEAPRGVRARTTDSAYSLAPAPREDASRKPSTLSVGRRASRQQPREAELVENVPVPDERPRLMDVKAGGLYDFDTTDRFQVSNASSWLRHLTLQASFGRRMAGSRTDSGQYVDVAPLDEPDITRHGADFRENFRRQFVPQRFACSLFPDGRVSGLAVIPWQWTARHEGRVHSPVILFEDWDGTKRRWILRLAIKDGSTSSVLSYLTQGDLGSAQLLLKDSLAFLMSKAENPYAAAAGGYVLIHSKDTDIDHGDWPSWLRNLASWFPWLPDAQILLATLFLQRRRLADRIEPGLSERDERLFHYARVLLERAMRAGIPIYSIGFRLLVENLEILGEMGRSRWPMGDEEGFPDRDALKFMRDLGSCITSVQPMTVLDLSGLWNSAPQSQRLYEPRD